MVDEIAHNIPSGHCPILGTLNAQIRTKNIDDFKLPTSNPLPKRITQSSIYFPPSSSSSSSGGHSIVQSERLQICSHPRKASGAAVVGRIFLPADTHPGRRRCRRAGRTRRVETWSRRVNRARVGKKEPPKTPGMIIKFKLFFFAFQQLFLGCGSRCEHSWGGHRNGDGSQRKREDFSRGGTFGKVMPESVSILIINKGNLDIVLSIVVACPWKGNVRWGE